MLGGGAEELAETIKCIRLVVEGEVIRVVGPTAVTNLEEEEEDGTNASHPAKSYM